MRLLFLTGSRGEWGYIRPILRMCQEQGIAYNICATNMHLLPSHGMSIQEIKNDGFDVSDEVYMSLEGHNHFTMTKSLGYFLSSFMDVMGRVKPDWLVLAGDRGEQLVGAIAGAYSYTPTAHIQAGELSGNIDGQARHAIGKFAHMHFASNEDAAERLRKLGEEEFRIKCVGAPQLDELVQGMYTDRETLQDLLDIDLSEPFMMMVQHSVTEEFDQVESQIKATMEAIGVFPMTKIWIFPNNDAGCDTVRQGILKYRRGRSHIFENLKREHYLGLLKNAQCIVGNSSSGLLEAPTFEVPAVNLGRRQAKRLQGKNVINAEFDVDAIRDAICTAISPTFRASLAGTQNPYGDGHSSRRILDILRTTPRTNELLAKQLTY